MRRALVLGLALALVVAPAAMAAKGGIKGKPNAWIVSATTFVDVPADAYTVGDVVPVSGGVDFGLNQYQTVWAFLDCATKTVLGYTDDGTPILALSGLQQWERIDDDAADAFETGTTPSWDGTTPRDCTVTLWLFDQWASDRDLGVSDALVLVP